FDCTNATMAGALRGYKDTRVPMIISLIGYWLIALPLGALLADGVFGLSATGVYGYWAGMTFGLALVAVAMGLRLRRTSRDAALIERLAQG
ncbi:MAG: MATE family efflux transporter, partial [Gammaproteobacteria bacterium]|nr:MATE family efflux transporter [Gammaproteobacteria bacterium]